MTILYLPVYHTQRITSRSVSVIPNTARTTLSEQKRVLGLSLILQNQTFMK